MPSLKDLKNRITSVKSTRKITAAMKMVAGSKLRRAQEHAEAARPYAERMARMLNTLVNGLVITETTPRLIAGTGKEDTVLLVVITSDRGLCGAFNGSIVRETRRLIRQLETEGKTVKLICIGRKGRDLLRRDHAAKIIKTYEDIAKKRINFTSADEITHKIVALFNAGEFDVARMVYNHFKSVMAQIVTVKQLVPVEVTSNQNTPPRHPRESGNDENGTQSVCEFEPDEETILAELLPRNLAVQIYAGLLDSAAGEQAARMTAMDNATRNAGDMINKLTLNYNRTRQAYITKELIEIISGAEAV